MWENVFKSQSVNVGMGIKITLADETNGGNVVDLNASFNTQTGKLSVGGVTVDLPVNPIDAIISSIGKPASLVEVAEKVIWDYVNDNPKTFVGGDK
jgi:hypothetical protein